MNDVLTSRTTSDWYNFLGVLKTATIFVDFKNPSGLIRIVSENSIELNIGDLLINSVVFKFLKPPGFMSKIFEMS